MTVTITTSWDDGHVLDWRVADLLDRYNLTGTFYIARDFLEERLSEAQIRDLAQRHEIGAHTFSHPNLTTLTLDQAHVEITGSKAWLEEVTGQPVTAFCYPGGRNTPALQTLVHEAGYSMARGVGGFALHTGSNRYDMPATLQMYPYPLRPLENLPQWRGWGTRLQPARHAWPHIRRLRLSPAALWNREALAHGLLQRAAQQDGVWHLWGHSWEIEQYGLWDALETVLRIAVGQTDHQAVTNSALVAVRHLA